MKGSQVNKSKWLFAVLFSVVFISLIGAFGLALLGLISHAEVLGVIIYFCLGGLVVLKLIDYVNNLKKN